VALAVAGQLGAYWWRSFREDSKPVQVGTADCLGLGFNATGEYFIAGLDYPRGIHVVGPVDKPVHLFPVTCRFPETVTVCSNTGSILVDNMRSELTCWQHRPGQELTQQWTLHPGSTTYGSRAAFGPDGSWFVRVTLRHFTFRSSSTGEFIREFRIPDLVYCGPVISPDGEWLAFGSRDSILAMRSDGQSRPIYLPNLTSHHFTDVAFHPSGKYLAATSNDKTVKLHDTTTWEISRTYVWEIGRMRCIAFSPDGMLAAAGSDTGKVVVWDVDT
jgi:WD40 repeat protein